MRLPGLIVVCLAAGCGGAAPASTQPEATAPDDAPETTPEPPQRPEVVERTVDDSDRLPDDGCTAERPETGVIDPESPNIARLEIVTYSQHIEEVVELRSGDKVEIAIGGCAHYGNSFSVVLDRDKDPADKKHYMFRALAVFDALPFRKDADTGLGEIRELITKHMADPQALADCQFYGDNVGFTSAGCTIEPVDVRVQVTLWRDFAL